MLVLLDQDKQEQMVDALDGDFAARQSRQLGGTVPMDGQCHFYFGDSFSKYDLEIGNRSKLSV